jgi:GTPase SAR1 family protein
LLSKYGYSQEIIEIVLNCISSHSSSSESKPINIIAKIVCDADALSHFEMLQFYYVSYTNPDLRFIDVLNKVYEKIEKSWAKIQLEESRALGKNKYRQVIRQLDFVRGVLKSK